MARTGAVHRLDDHPNLTEILGVLAQLAHIRDADLQPLADAWVNTPELAEARDLALSPDSPLVLEVLAAFDAVSALFADDLRGEADYVTVDPKVTTTALKAVRDAIASAYARPILTRHQHAMLLRPWRTVYPEPLYDEPDLGPAADQVRGLLTALPSIAQRCHDARGQQIYESLATAAWTLDRDSYDTARDAAWNAAILTSRRRVWTLVRRSVAEGLGRPCRTCHNAIVDDDDEARVANLCLDAACALLVSDALPQEMTHVLTAPLSSLIPQQRTGS